MSYTIRSLPPIDNDYENIENRENLVDSENNEEFCGDFYICIPPQNENEVNKLFELLNRFFYMKFVLSRIQLGSVILKVIYNFT